MIVLESMQGRFTEMFSQHFNSEGKMDTLGLFSSNAKGNLFEVCKIMSSIDSIESKKLPP